MSLYPLSVGLMGVLFSLAATYSLYQAWQRKSARAGFILAGIALLILSFSAWVWGYGPDQGIAFGLIALPVLAWFWASFSIDIKSTRTRKSRDTSPSEIAPRTMALWLLTLRRIFIVILSGPIALIAACGGILGVFALLGHQGMNGADQLAIALFLAPILWGIYAMISVCDMRLWRRSALILGLGLSGFVLAFTFQASALKGIIV